MNICKATRATAWLETGVDVKDDPLNSAGSQAGLAFVPSGLEYPCRNSPRETHDIVPPTYETW